MLLQKVDRNCSGVPLRKLPGTAPRTSSALELLCCLLSSGSPVASRAFSFLVGVGGCFASDFSISLSWDSVTQSHSVRPRSLRHFPPLQAGPCHQWFIDTPHPIQRWWLVMLPCARNCTPIALINFYNKPVMEALSSFDKLTLREILFTHQCMVQQRCEPRFFLKNHAHNHYTTLPFAELSWLWSGSLGISTPLPAYHSTGQVRTQHVWPHTHPCTHISSGEVSNPGIHPVLLAWYLQLLF